LDFLEIRRQKHPKGIFISWFLIRIEPMSAITGQETKEVINASISTKMYGQ